MLDKMKELWEMKRKMDEIKKELDAITLESEDNFVKIGISGSQDIKSVTIKGELACVDRTKLEAAIVETVNRAIKQSQKSAAEKMSKLSGLNIPGLS
jgi:DNA-binding protein YbaB